VKYNEDGTATALNANGVVYYWQVTLYDENGAPVSAPIPAGQFTTTASATTLTGSKFDLEIDWNNPFDPGLGQVTKFRFMANDRDRLVRLRVFTITGELVREWPEQTILQGAQYVREWDGGNLDGKIVARGLYLVNLMDVGDKKGITRRVAVIKSK